MIVIYFNPNKNVFYSKYIQFYFSKNCYVGYKNQYNHEIVALFYIRGNKVISCTSIDDYREIRKNYGLKNKIINYLIYRLNRLKGGE